MKASDRFAVAFWIGILFLLSSAPLASAHAPQDYWRAEWPSQSRGTTDQDYEFTQTVPGDSNGNFADRVAGGGQAWNAIDINNPDMRFRRNGEVDNYDPFNECALADYRNGIHFKHVPDNAFAVAPTCIHNNGPLTDTIHNFQIVFDPSHSWFYGTNSGNIQAGEVDVEGVATHEFGHSVGGWHDAASCEDVNDCFGGHYDDARNGQLCDVPSSGRHTMCALFRYGFGGVYARTLETHDIDVFVTAYQ